MKFNSKTTCCFSGYRPEKFAFPLRPPAREYELLLEGIRVAVVLSAVQGYATFLCGMARGFDILCGEAVLRAKAHPELAHIELAAVLPYAGHGANWRGTMDCWGARGIL